MAHTGLLFKLHNILKIQDIYKLKIALYAFQNREQIECLYQRPQPYNTRFGRNLYPAFQRLSITRQSIHYRLPTIWN